MCNEKDRERGIGRDERLFIQRQREATEMAVLQEKYNDKVKALFLEKTGAISQFAFSAFYCQIDNDFITALIRYK